MKRKFECWNCHKEFVGDDSNWVECPHCHSDNVEYYKRRIPKNYYKVCCCLMFMVIVFFAVCKFWPDQGATTPQKVYGDTEADMMAQQIDSAYIAEGGTIEPSLSLAEIEYNEDNDSYKCRFQVDYPPSQPWKVVVMSYRGNKLIAESNDGEFNELPFSEFDGFYIVRLLNRDTNEPIIDDKEFPDFSKQVKIKKPWNAAELEKRLNGTENLTDNDYLADKHQVVIVNKPSHDTTPTGTLREVQNLLKMFKLHAKVLSLEYDDMKKISAVKLNINYPSNWMQDEEEDEIY